MRDTRKRRRTGPGSARGLALLAASLLTTVAAGAAPPGDPPDRARLARVRQVLEVARGHRAQLLAIGDVVGTGTALGDDGEPVIRVLTARPGVRDVPSRVDGVPVDVRVTGRIHALRGPTCDVDGDAVCQTTERWPLPVPIGVSVGHPSITAGTIGARVTDGAQVFALSNNHVLASSNLASLGDAALQPGPFDGGTADDAIGTLADFEPIAFCTAILPPILYSCPVVNSFDAAIALTSPAELGFATPEGQLGSAPGYGAPNVQLHAAYGDPTLLGDEDLAQLLQLGVQKHGRTTGPTAGVVDTIGLTVDVCYDELCSLLARFEDQLAVPGAFSAGGDSGSLVVTDDALKQPVGLLFAGSETQTIVSRIDLVLQRFGVSVDDGGTSAPVTNASVQALDTPSYLVLGETGDVSVTVRNAGTEPLPAFGVTLDDTLEGTSQALPVPPLAPAAVTTLDFSFAPTMLGSHGLVATLQIADDEPADDQVADDVQVLARAPGVTLRPWSGTARTDAWTEVALPADYGADMVVVCTPLYDATALGPLVARVRNASGDRFEVGLGRPWFGAFPGEETSGEVHCLIARAGVYDAPAHRLEAVRVEGFAAKDDASSWLGQARSYGQAYASPVVVGQVISPDGAGAPGEIGAWSQFWARGATSFDPPSASALFVGRHTGEDPGPRPAETLAYIVLEAGTGTASGYRYEAGLSAEFVRGVDDAPPYDHTLSGWLVRADAGAVSSAGMDGIEGGWPILYGSGAVTTAMLSTAIDEDWYFDPERSHTTEQVAWVAVGRRPTGCGIGFELAFALPWLWALGRRRAPRPEERCRTHRPRTRPRPIPR